MTDKLTHLWIIVFIVSFTVFTVKSAEDTQPGSALKTEVRSAMWRFLELQDSGDDGDRFMNRDSSKRQSSNKIQYWMCVKTSNKNHEAGTTDNIEAKVYGRYSQWSKYTSVHRDGGFPAGNRNCQWVEMEDLQQKKICNVDVRTDGVDDWRPDGVNLYVPSWEVCFLCNASSCKHHEDWHCNVNKDYSLRIDCGEPIDEVNCPDMF